MSTPGDDVETVLGTLHGADLYRNNIFRITGLPTDASTAQISRAREETLLALSVGAAPRPPEGEPPAGPTPDIHTIRAAYETLRDPVARLIHELLWLSRTEDVSWPGQAEHDRAVWAHCTAVETERAGPLEPASPQAPALDELWSSGLRAWAATLATPEFWEHAKRRVRQLDDPRLTTGTVRRLRQKLPRHLAAVTVELALHATRLSEPAANRLIGLLAASPLPDEVVGALLGDAVRPARQAILAACAAAGEALRRGDADPEGTARDLLAHTAGQLATVRALRGPDEPLTRALSDELAVVVNNCAVAHHRWTGRGDIPVTLLDRAGELARVRATRALIAENRRIIRTNVVMAELLAMCEQGQIERAGRRLRAMARYVRDDELAKAFRGIAATAGGLGAPVRRAPRCALALPVSAGLLGRRAAEDGRFIDTQMLTVCCLPVLPLAAYLRDHRQIHARVPLGTAARWWRLTLLTAVLALTAVLVVDAPNIVVVTGVIACVLGVLALRQVRLRRWVRQRVIG